MSELLHADIEVKSVEPKEGMSAAGRHWKAFFVHASSGVKYATFDGTLGSQATAAVGRLAHITYEQTEKGYTLKSLAIDEAAIPAAEPVRAQTQNGTPDWDMIGLHKTRCALWVAAISSGMGIAAAREIVLAAEIDIFHRQPADDLSDIPF